ncbi:MAG: ComEA family DNA-binding protein [Terriglobales bacterium]
MPALDDKIDLNNAGVALLTQLPGVAKNVAYAIVNYRTAHGGFRRWEDLRKLPSLGKSRRNLDAIKARAFLGPRPATKDVPRRVLSHRLGKSKHDGLHNHG